MKITKLDGSIRRQRSRHLSDETEFRGRSTNHSPDLDCQGYGDLERDAGDKQHDQCGKRKGRIFEEAIGE